MLGHALCRSNSSSEKSALAAIPQIGGNPALGLESAGGARRREASVPRRQNIEPSTILWGLKFVSPSRVWHGRIKVNSQLLPVDKKTLNWSASVRVPPKTALARATCPLGTHSSGKSNPCGVENTPEKKRASKMLHSRYG